MGLQLFNFVYNTLLGKANSDTPNNSLFLPRALAGMTGSNGQPYLPIQADDWTLNNMSGAQDISNNMANSWFNAFWNQLYLLSQATPNPPAVTQQMIDDAKTACGVIMDGPNLSAQPYPGAGPDLNVQQIEIDGLSNVSISGAAPQVTVSDAGYQVQIQLDFNAYPSTGQDWNQALALGGSQAGVDSSNQQAFLGLRFSLSQCLGFFARRSSTLAPLPPTLPLTPTPGKPNGFDCQASGLALLQISNAEIVANTTVTVSPDGKLLQIGLQQLALRGNGSAAPVFALQNLQWQSMAPTLSADFSIYFDIWTTFYKNLLATPEAAALLTSNINAALNSPDNLGQVESLLNQQLASAFNSIFGSSQVASSAVDSDSNAVDKYLFNRARAALNDQSSYVYVPTLVLGSTAPVLEPYTALNLSLDGPFSKSVMGQNLTLSQIALSSLEISGLSNLLAPADSIAFGSNQQASANLLLGCMNPGPMLNVKGHPMTVPSPPAVATTPFRLNVQVGANTPIPLSGKLTLTLQNNSGTLGVDTTLTSSGDTPDAMSLHYSAITLVAADGDLAISVQLDGPMGASFSPLVNEVLDQGQVKEAILSALNDYIGAHLDQISQAATQFARNALDSLGS
ncbi:hypothetical protein [Pseudoduganella sp. HUAS MS19]